MRRPLYIGIGLVATALGIVGLFVPLMPTTGFLLIAAWAFARSSPRLEAWLRGHPSLWPLIVDWEERRAIPVKAKVLAVAGMSLSLAIMWRAGVATAWLAVTAVVLAAIAGWIVTRPS